MGGLFAARLATGDIISIANPLAVAPDAIARMSAIDYPRWVRDLALSAYVDDVASTARPMLALCANFGACSNSDFRDVPGITLFRDHDPDFEARCIAWVPLGTGDLVGACLDAVTRTWVGEQVNDRAPGGDLCLVTAGTVVAGRDSDYDELATKSAGHLGNGYGYPEIELLSWDEFYRRSRLAQANGDGGLASSGPVALEATRMACRHLLRGLATNIDDLVTLDHRRFEELIAMLLVDVGFDLVELTPNGPDGGKDLVVSHFDALTSTEHLILVECKHWTSGRKVDVKIAATLQDVKQRGGADTAVLISSSGFTPRLTEMRGRFVRDCVHLRDAEDIRRLVAVRERTFASPLTYRIDPVQVLLGPS